MTVSCTERMDEPVRFVERMTTVLLTGSTSEISRTYETSEPTSFTIHRGTFCLQVINRSVRSYMQGNSVSLPAQHATSRWMNPGTDERDDIQFLSARQQHGSMCRRQQHACSVCSMRSTCASWRWTRSPRGSQRHTMTRRPS